MRIHVNHATLYSYDPPAHGAIQALRLTPRNHDGQYVVSWRIDVSEGCRLRAHEDAFGNLTHTFAIDGPIGELRVLVEGEVETQDTAGVIRGIGERFPPSLFLRATDLTTADADLAGFAETATAGEADRIAKLHLLMEAVAEAMTFDPDPTHASTSATQAFELKRGVCQDFAHIFTAGARHLGIPARYVSGYLVGDGAEPEQRAGHQAGHAWAEAHVEGLGWIGFDAANRQCPTDAYVRVAVGLDYLGAAPVRGNRYGGGDENLTVALKVDQSSRQIQG
ncbi:transglutaminase domain protein [Ancylobacter novellus DSM 506]|uniref:Transglutaminase domain protein n=1 Tax=Ancylobacter novellus (strain ATCC 8093 / DSM 506 / JCM 20403 / CCM 1077 / IAM 12100 / NBRC 12443 / NCIMB 10456) TaxID=639283 RepID=D7A0C3_ANCN5|nr:transglutaminase family protein [Ancylobacter novellus]ADH89384.1 transglutaminase domain protein [Ancylobacter novellus DSM 506]